MTPLSYPWYKYDMNATLKAGTKVRFEEKDGTVGAEVALTEDVAVEVLFTFELGSIYRAGDAVIYVDAANEEA